MSCVFLLKTSFQIIVLWHPVNVRRILKHYTLENLTCIGTQNGGLVQMILLFNRVIFRLKILIFRRVAGVPSIKKKHTQVVVWHIFYFRPDLGRDSHFDEYFSGGLKLETTNQKKKTTHTLITFLKPKKKTPFWRPRARLGDRWGLHGCHEWCVEGGGWMSCCGWRCLECPLVPKPWNPGSCWEMKEAKLGGFGPSFLGEPSHGSHGMIVYLPRWIPIKINHSCR